MRPRETIPMCVAVLGLAAGTVQAVPLTYIFEGTIQSKTDPADLLPDVDLADEVIYTVMVDSETPRLPSDPNFGIYQADSAILRVKETSYVVDPPVIRVFLASAYGLLDVGIHSASAFGGYPASGNIVLVDDQGTAIPDRALPEQAFDLELFERRSFSVTLFGPIIPPDPYESETIIWGSLHRFTIIPEPGTACLLVCGVVLSGRRRFLSWHR